ncbi:SusC/RagA family TonB-linked outer membrane protein [Saccharicrinis sp. FJH62]|uniref:SusC/RagA family TonB-linked outer membrane protein n=1 Tax=Saccharicrinis sp. FJH62 TaxID=3344657 RepID=UPI0035D42CF2
MKKCINLFLVICMLLTTVSASAQEPLKITGKIFSPYNNEPVKGAVITSSVATESATTDSLGQFSLEVSSLDGTIEVWGQGYFQQKLPILGKSTFEITMIPSDKFDYNQDKVLPFHPSDYNIVTGNSQNINEKNIDPGASTVDDALLGNISGLYMINKSGMPGEGSYLNLRGIQSVLGNNAPLIILNGVPYLPDMNESPIIGGYSKGIFNAISVNDIENITLLKGQEASLYGSIGSNGVLLIETKKATDLETAVEYSGQYGMAFNNSTLPVLNVSDFKAYIGDVGITQYADMGEFLTDFPFLRDDPDYYYQFLYNNNTNWQQEIYRPAFVTDNNIRIKGGDAVAKYDLSVGYFDQQGTVDNSSLARYNTRLNANINLGQNIDLFSSVGFAFLTSSLYEQGMLSATNPLLTALYKAPILNPHRKDAFNNTLPGYDAVRQFGVSNPLAVVNQLTIGSDVYDFSFNTGINYRVIPKLTFTGTFGLYYNYSRENAFISGKDNLAVLPLQDGFALNTARAGVGEAVNYYSNVNGVYKTLIGKNPFNLSLGFQSLITRHEYDAGKGTNTASDFYRTLDYVTQDKDFWGYIEEWNWMNFYGHADYTLNNLLTLSANASYDAASSTGQEATRWGIFPSGGATLYLKNTSFLTDVDPINKLNLRGEYGVSGNSRFSTRISKYYYLSTPFRNLSGIARGNMPNTLLKWETSKTFDAGLDMGMFKNRLQAEISYYSIITSDVIMPSKTQPEYGIEEIIYNQGEISNKGFELSLMVDVISNRNFGFTLGGNACLNKNVLESLGSSNEIIHELSDGSAVISRVGESVYSFYGYETEGVFASQQDAENAGLTDYKGDPFNAGDIIFKDSYGNDNIIDARDRTIIGNANPDVFGALFANFRYKQLDLSASFGYSYGNDMYNAVRRSLEAVDSYNNQSAAVVRRWQTEGQITDIPKVTYNDPMKNNRFSDRWIEDASYIKLRSITLSYTLKPDTYDFIKSGIVYVSAENLYTLTNYLGLDPVTSYSYDPMMQGFDYAKTPAPASVKLGLKLQF